MTIATRRATRHLFTCQPLFLALQILAFALFAGMAFAQSGVLPSPSGGEASGNDLLTGTASDAPAAPQPPAANGAMPPPMPSQPGTPPPLPQLNMFVALNGQPAGPFNQMQIHQMMTAGQINAQTLVWKEGMPDWAPAARVPELQALVQTPSNPPQPDPQTTPTTPMDATRFFTGRWTMQNGTIPAGAQSARIAGILTYMADGTYTARAKMTLPGGAGQPEDIYDVTGNGTWTATMLGNDRISVNSVDDITMTSRTTGQSQQSQTTDSSTYQIVDQDTLRDEYGNLMKRSR